MAQRDKQLSKIDRLNRRMNRYMSMDRLVLFRGLAYGGAASCLIIIIQLAQIGGGELALHVAVVAASIGLPLWLLLGATSEVYISLGKQSYPHFRSMVSQFFFGMLLFLGGTALAAAVGGLLWHILPEAAVIFGIAAIACILLVNLFHWWVAHWWFGENGPTSRESEE